MPAGRPHFGDETGAACPDPRKEGGSRALLGGLYVQDDIRIISIRHAGPE